MPEYGFLLTRIFEFKGKYWPEEARILAYFSPILSLHGKIRVRENPNSDIS